MAKIGIFVGTVYGNAQMVAEKAQALLQEAGHDATVFDEGTLEEWQAYERDVVLVVTSTTGQGDLPDSIEPLFYDIKDSLGHQPSLRYGVIALGDSNYENFSGAGKKFDALLQDQEAKRVGEVLIIDSSEISEPEEFAEPWIRSWAALING
ncbi:flavodoxin [Leminorella grimontii]|uniref:Flavodoxin n=1 Tax=Leminorella grimontii TaxID=82981 RepID=A0AAV5N3U5_9GAMM|nr:flavodoxin [Leminorella grimontii]KFC97300.1 putative flavoprotein [Leminorella grimontii ATCC 33999 = DSM 5078]GKX55347.1 flavodoxin [Leminorella grimontii]GKX58766.1 flavodoxin [Leminorella grimontii]VFS56503.1 flavodoxin [Leminorella grimontii]